MQRKIFNYKKFLNEEVELTKCEDCGCEKCTCTCEECGNKVCTCVDEDGEINLDDYYFYHQD
jgi:hypothetical protein